LNFIEKKHAQTIFTGLACVILMFMGATIFLVSQATYQIANNPELPNEHKSLILLVMITVLSLCFYLTYIVFYGFIKDGVGIKA